MAWIDLKKRNRRALDALKDPIPPVAPKPLVLDLDENAATPVESESLGRLARLQPFSPVAICLMRQFDREETDYAEVVRLIGSDTALAAETLALANSALFGMHRNIKDLTQAVAVLGTDHTRALAATLAMRAFLKSAPRTGVVRRLWRHSIATAVIAKELAPVYGVNPDLASTGGVLHDVGRMGLLAAYREEYGRLVLRMFDNVEAILLAERELCGLDHCAAGVFLSKAWALPNLFELMIGQHHHAKGESGIAGLIHVACTLADDMSFAAVVRRPEAYPADHVAECVPEEFRGQVKEIWREAEHRIAEKVVTLDF